MESVCNVTSVPHLALLIIDFNRRQLNIKTNNSGDCKMVKNMCVSKRSTCFRCCVSEVEVPKVEIRLLGDGFRELNAYIKVLLEIHSCIGPFSVILFAVTQLSDALQCAWSTKFFTGRPRRF
jgi:hypothetical protein